LLRRVAAWRAIDAVTGSITMRDRVQSRAGRFIFGCITSTRVAALVMTEPALAQRPGRIDLAVEVPLPDAVARRRLLALYGPGLVLDADEVEAVVTETDSTLVIWSVLSR
jgi:hypothetical protein